ncbi:MAG TPA: dTMP kinase [Gemmatimonadaceae bacterium]|nr:dTMP kinase [Gemmatimonadaceae bacterium]
MAGLLVVFEGSEGAGKSTQLRRLADALVRDGHDVVAVREPGGTHLGDAIRQVLLDPASDIEPAAEALLFMASRAQLVAGVVRPALARGAIVLVDRFFLSTYAYQVEGRGLPLERIRDANRLAVGDLVPHVTLLLALPGADGLARAALRGDPDRMEQIGDAFHARVSAAFTRFATPAWQAEHPECGPIVTVDASGDVETVGARIQAVLHDRWPETFARRAGSHRESPGRHAAARDVGQRET